MALRDQGLKVGLLDADIYGPSVPRLAGVHGKPEVIDGRTMLPMDNFGLQLMSIGFMVEEDTPMIWRGPMVMSALAQMLREVSGVRWTCWWWTCPPATGDAQLTMAQQVNLPAGAVIVSTPQDLALIDARRGIAMFKRVNVPFLGIVENMATFICPHCGGRSDIFGHGGARAEAEKLGVPFPGRDPAAYAHPRDVRCRPPHPGLGSQQPAGGRLSRGWPSRVRASMGRVAAAARPAPKIVIE